jgi:hypothetical protein
VMTGINYVKPSVKQLQPFCISGGHSSGSLRGGKSSNTEEMHVAFPVDIDTETVSLLYTTGGF